MDPSKRTATIKAHITEQEREALEAHAQRLNMTASSFARNILVNYKLPKGAINARAIRDLLKINADLARLGNLLKMAMMEDEFPALTDPDLAPEILLERIDQTRAILKAKIIELHNNPPKY